MGNPGGQSRFQVEEALLVLLNIHEVSSTTLQIQERPTTYCLYRSTTEGGRTLASFGSWPNSRRAHRWCVRAPRPRCSRAAPPPPPPTDTNHTHPHRSFFFRSPSLFFFFLFGHF